LTVVPAGLLLGRTAPANEAVAERTYRAWAEGETAGTLDRDDLLTVLETMAGKRNAASVPTNT
jgi:hypothetical protein